ncbi:type II toxin-antitoxin system RelE/ParE family toxin [Endozoicomonas arenosclerae]|uniref:type II toxin-antitoxin system RelE/ParE family toxin n=1 Tax=Endozoicomonas arenosclerae TaxID=1633495 RepID=UPI0007844A07|nr:type II toxin-antitoxin system RelE/ParE family toxin [Endozoicomonas arenosclerae]
MTCKVREYIRDDGSSPYKNWFNRLPSQAAAKVATAIVRMETGNTSSIKWFSGLGECKINWGPGLRIYLTKEDDNVNVLFGGGDKASQQSDIAKATKLLAEYKARKKSSNLTKNTLTSIKGKK